MASTDLDRAFAKLRAAAAGLPELEEGISYGTPCLKVRGKSLARVKDRDTLVLMCPLEEKELLIAAAPDIYYETDHYKGWPAVLVRLAAISARELHHRMERVWRMRAPKRLVALHDKQSARPTGDSGRRTRTRPARA